MEFLKIGVENERKPGISGSMKFLTEDERAIILSCMHKKQDSRLYKRLYVIILYDDGLSVAKIASFFYMDEETIRSYIESFRNDGMPDIKIFRYN